MDKTDKKLVERVDWTSALGKKHPILIQYQHEVNIPYYAHRIYVMLDERKQEYHYHEQDSMLVLKDV